MSSIYDWSVTPGSNATADTSINWSEGMFPSSVNDSARQMMARIAQWIKDKGALPATGTNTIAVTSASQITSIATGMSLAFKAAATNTTAVTLNLNGLGGKEIRKTVAGSTDSSPLEPGDINIKGLYFVQYDASSNAGAGAWILLNPSTASFLKLSGGTLSGTLNISNTAPQLRFIETDFSDKNWILIADGTTWSVREDTTAGANTRFSISPGGAVSIAGTLSSGSFSTSGSATAAGNVTANQNFISSTAVAVLAATGSGQILLRPNGTGSSAGQLVVANTGNITTGGTIDSGAITSSSSVTSSQNFASAGTNVVLSTTGAGTVFLRPNGSASGTGQTTLSSSGNLTVGGTVAGDNISTNGNVVGAAWSPWGSTSAVTAISSRIEARAAAYAAIGRGVGVGQTWNTSIRNSGQWYTNSTGQPIYLAVYCFSGTTAIQLAGNNDTGAPVQISPTGTSVGAVIPAGATYRHNSTASFSTYELS